MFYHSHLMKPNYEQPQLPPLDETALHQLRCSTKAGGKKNQKIAADDLELQLLLTSECRWGARLQMSSGDGLVFNQCQLDLLSQVHAEMHLRLFVVNLVAIHAITSCGETG